MKIFKHLILILKHKFWVLLYCARVGIIWRGITHDLSKFAPTEFFRSVKYFQGYQSPVNAERQKFDDFSYIAAHHAHHNKHHFEYWVDFHRGYIIVKRMPYKYALEYVCDMISASKIYKKKDFSYQYVIDFFLTKMDYYLMHPDTKLFIIECLHILNINGWKGLKGSDKIYQIHLIESEIIKMKLPDNNPFIVSMD